ncbi:MAG TPA: NAD+ synthase, partial [Myxococcales bacterium]|nr:NAD+ synthase [Myxococcales bacterium]
MKLGLGQINTTIGDLDGNLAKMSAYAEQALEQGCSLVLFPEMAVTGYPPLDLLDRPSFVAAAEKALDEWAKTLPNISVIVGNVAVNPAKQGRSLWNAAVLVTGGKVHSVHPKTLLPTYDVFDEDRWFEPLQGEPQLGIVGAMKLGITVCEDIWNAPLHREHARYHSDPVAKVVAQGAQIIINISASPFAVEKSALRQELLIRKAREHGVPVVFLNQVGGNDGLIFDGRSLVVSAEGQVVAQGSAFQEELLVVDLDELPEAISVSTPLPEADICNALTLGISDYFSKIGLKKAVVGLSGGIDSAVTAVLAVDALGSDNVVGIGMPSEFSSQGSIDDAQSLAENLGICFHLLPIQPPLVEIRSVLDEVLGPKPWGVADENLQARLRGMILMAYSNKHGHLVLSTGNKSELAVGYCTLYGDMCGGLAVISDLPKTMVFRVARHLNKDGERIPENTITKPPSAELRPDQRDDQSLPPYELLDHILQLYVEERLEVSQIVEHGL